MPLKTILKEEPTLAAKFYLWVTTFLAGVLAYYTDLHFALYFFLGATVMDTITAIDVSARQKGLIFRPWKRYFWLQITSEGLKGWLDKVFWKYGKWLIMAFMINEWVLKNMIIFDMFDRKLTLPVVAIYVFGFVELWSVGENIEKGGEKNIFKMFYQFLPDKVQRIFKSTNEDFGDNGGPTYEA